MHNGGDLIEKGFQLASFILQDRSAAIRVVMNAINKLEIQHNREQKRAYWRDKHLKGKITRIARRDTDALQWLIYFESEGFEKQQEQSGEQTNRAMIIRYIKHLVQLSTPMSAFYVSVGLHRLLHNYSTSEVQRVYEWVTEHYPGTQEYRRVKGALMTQLQERFATMIQTTRGQHGELRFETMENQESWADLVDECLRVFTPWSTSADSAVLRRVDVLGDFSLDALGKERGVDRDRVEMYRCHAFIDPDWYGQITEKLGLAPPREKLAVPRFSLNTRFQDYDNSGGFTTTTPKLTEDERRSIAEHLSVEAKRRQQFEPNLLKIVAHGREYARFHIDRAESHYCELPEGVKLIEVWVEQDGTDVLVGTHWVAYTEWQGIAAARATVSLMDGRELLLTITPLEERTGCASLVLVCRSVSPSASRATFETIRWFRLKPRLALLAVSLVALGWIAGTMLSRRDLSRQQEKLEAVSKELAQEKELRKALQHSIANEGESRPPGIYRLIPDDIHIRSSENAGATVVRLSAKSPLVILELPVADRKKAYRAALTPFLKQREILSESFIEPLRRDEASFVELSLPSSLVSDGEHYVISLRSIGKGGSVELYRTFTFLVVKE